MLGLKLWTIRQKQEQRSKKIAAGIFKLKTRKQQQEEEESRRVFGGNYISNYTRHHQKESVLRRPESGQTLKQPKEPTPDEVRLAKEQAEFKEMMQAKLAAKQAARAEEEKAEFLDFMRKWIETKWDGEAPDHLKKALSTRGSKGSRDAYPRVA